MVEDATPFERTKFIADGAATIPDAVRKIRAYADYLEKLGERFELDGEVKDGWLYLEARKSAEEEPVRSIVPVIPETWTESDEPA